jgi:hypothetical protein
MAAIRKSFPSRDPGEAWLCDADFMYLRRTGRAPREETLARRGRRQLERTPGALPTAPTVTGAEVREAEAAKAKREARGEGWGDG